LTSPSANSTPTETPEIQTQVQGDGPLGPVCDHRSPPQQLPKLGFWQLWNMSFGFFGIQFGWGLQMANTSAIFEQLGANAHQIPILWLAAPSRAW
jgi:hypothetical protein